MANQAPEIKYYEQLPPQHNLAEEILLGGIILNSNIIETVIGELIAESFALERHQLIYRTIIDIYIEKKHINSIILINQLWELNLLNKIGGINKILQLLQQAQIFTSKIITKAAIKYYTTLIQDKYLRRQLIQYGYDVINMAYNSSIDSVTISFKLDRYISYLKKQLFYEDVIDINLLINQVFLNLKSPETRSQHYGLLSHFHSLDLLTGGFKKGDLIVIAGRPSMGKTSLSLNIGLNIIENEAKSIIFFSLEMSKEQILYKLLSMKSKIPISNIRKGQIQQDEWINLQKAGKLLAEARINIDDTANLSIMQIGVKVKNLLDVDPEVSLLVIDYLQLIRIPNHSFKNRTEELSEITRTLKMLAKSVDMPILVLSQLNRNVEGRVIKRPLLADLRESGCLSRLTSVLNFISYKRIYSPVKLVPAIKSSSLTPTLVHRKNNTHIEYSYKQYLYQVLKRQNKISTHLTHNHLLLTNLRWDRTDNLKYFRALIYLDLQTQIVRIDEVVQNIYLLKKYNSYDISVPNEKMFFTNDYIFTHNSIEQDADLVLLLFRESYYNQNIDDDNLTEIIIAKHRNGPIGTSRLKFQPEISTFNE
jgi:replicative DNA helicase|uniref:Replicative DNA helicase n=1 Tax=Palmaria decipiens TaxID=187399 RepID=A0A6C0W497_PALDE|nr:replicative DNA helicase subunit [Palmaria decipiens]QIC19496.1 replicative DNA helicase subunit [Palmaria decipiens]